MRIMAYLGSLVFLVLGVGALLWWRRNARDEAGGSSGLGVCTIPLPYLAALAGWVLTEVGRQPWIVWGLLKTADANSPSVSTHDDCAEPRRLRPSVPDASRFVNFVLLRRYARLDPPEVGGEGDEFAVPVASY